MIDPLIVQSQLSGDTAPTRAATRLNAAETPATASAHRIAVFHSTCRGRGGGSAPVDSASDALVCCSYSCR